MDIKYATFTTGNRQFPLKSSSFIFRSAFTSQRSKRRTFPHSDRAYIGVRVKNQPPASSTFLLSLQFGRGQNAEKALRTERLPHRLGIYCCDTDDCGRFIITIFTIGKSFIIWNPSPGPICEMWLKLVGAEISLERISASISARPPSLTLNPNRYELL